MSELASERISTTLTALLKLGLAGASLVAVAWLIVVLDGSGDVRETNADIISLNPVPVSNTARFEDTLETLGHSAPETYDYNGNEVSFSTRVSRKRPEQLLREYQEAFVRHGVNEEVYLPYGRAAWRQKQRQKAGGDEAPSYKKRRDAMLSGQMVPTGLTENYMSMSGGLLKGNAQTREQLNDYMQEKGFGRFEDEFAAYRQIEAFRDAVTGKTTVTASWSDESFDIKKHAETKYPKASGVNPDTTVPSCPGCIRQMRFTGKENTKPYTVNAFATDQRRDRVVDFYDRALHRRGWQRTETNRRMDQVMQFTDLKHARNRRLLQYTNGAQFLTILVQTDPSLDKTTVTTYQTD